MAAETKARRRVARRRSSAARTRPRRSSRTSTPLEGQIQGLEARVTAIEKYLQATHGNSRAWDAVKALKILIGDDRRGGGGAPVASTTVEDQIQGLQDRVAVIELYLQAAGGSGNSRQQIHKLLQMLADSDGGSR